MKILVLEDDSRRRSAMEVCLKDRFRHYDVCFFVHPQPLVDFLSVHLNDVLLISLDHDMELVSDGAGGWIDPGTGRLVVDFLVHQSPVCPVVIHSSNASATLAMCDALEEAGWSTHVVGPYGDLAWVGESWFPTVRRAIVDSARAPSKAT